MGRLFKEVVEVITFEFHNIPRIHMSAPEIERHYGLELADCLAWTIGAANIKGIDVEKATLERFWPVCWKCGTTPCQCTNFNMDEVRLNSETLRNLKR